MQYVKLNEDKFVGDRMRSAGEVLPFPDKVADLYVRGKHGVIVPEPSAIQQATVPAAPEQAVSRRGRQRPRAN